MRACKLQRKRLHHEEAQYSLWARHKFKIAKKSSSKLTSSTMSLTLLHQTKIKRAAALKKRKLAHWSAMWTVISALTVLICPKLRSSPFRRAMKVHSMLLLKKSQLLWHHRRNRTLALRKAIVVPTLTIRTRSRHRVCSKWIQRSQLKSLISKTKDKQAKRIWSTLRQVWAPKLSRESYLSHLNQL